MATAPATLLSPTLTGSAVSTPEVAAKPAPVVPPAPAPVTPTPTTATTTTPLVSTSKLALNDVTKKMATVNNASTAIQAQQNVKTPPAAASTVKVFNQNGIANDVPSMDLSYWQTQGWSTTPPAASSPPPATTGTTAPPAGDTAGGTSTPPGTNLPTSDLNAFGTAMKGLSDEAKAASDKFQSDVNNIKNGSYPLTSDQQASIDQITQSYQQLMAQQTIANQNFVGGTTEAGISSGRNRYAPEVELGNIASAVNAGVQQIAKLNGEMVSAVTTAKIAFEDNNLKLLTAAYDRLDSSIKERQQTIDDMWKATTDAVTQAQKNQEIQDTEAHNTYMEKLQSDQFTLDQKKEAFNEVMQSSQFTLDQKKEAADEWYKQQDIAIKGAQLQLDRQKTAFDEGALTDVGGVGATMTYDQKMKIPGVQSVNGGGLYFDPTQFGSDAAGKKQATAAQRVATAAGIKTLTPKEKDSLTTISTAIDNVKQNQQLFNSLAPQGATQFVESKYENPLSEIFRTNFGKNLDAYNTYNLTLANMIKGVAPALSRITQTELLNATNALPTVSGWNSLSHTDTVSGGQKKFDKVTQALTDAKTELLGKVQYDSLDSYVSANPSPSALAKIQGFQFNASSPKPAVLQAIDFVKTKFPDASPEDVLQLLQSL